MLGAAGALACFALCTGAGLVARDGARQRAYALMAWLDALHVMKLLLSEERLPMDALLCESARAVDEKGAAEKVRRRLERAGEQLRAEPALTVEEAYAGACREILMPFEDPQERGSLELLFRQLGGGTAAMREQAVKGALNRLGLICDKAREKADKAGALYGRLGLLGGLAMAIILW